MSFYEIFEVDEDGHLTAVGGSQDEELATLIARDNCDDWQIRFDGEVVAWFGHLANPDPNVLAEAKIVIPTHAPPPD